jgi:hypothetical protein
MLCPRRVAPPFQTCLDGFIEIADDDLGHVRYPEIAVTDIMISS